MLTGDSGRQRSDLLLRGGLLFTGTDDLPIRADLAVGGGRVLAIGPDLGAARLSLAEALKAATLSAAELLGLGDRIGALKPGMDADLVVVRGDALDFAQLAERIEGVFVAGARVRG